MEFNPKNDKGTWFYFNEEDESQGGICLRVMPEQKRLEINKRINSPKTKIKKGVSYVEENINLKLMIGLLLDYHILDWSNIVVDGEEVECTYENKSMLNNDPAFSHFVDAKVEKLQEKIEALNGFGPAKN